ncbi:hypothetical protein CYMTET_24253 [Cymbomonas tetramitiformis]|uniref:Uncharacterized protein n=1 Tax=Cymbomonas tetramitiformis TaxID=36881 RepID=A0AAE0FWS2_9CHLO|nr:hypothetical protein CYMTET_24253 [Cymbomonas tetramitiformis]
MSDGEVNFLGQPFAHKLRIRYAECDMQGRVHNSNFQLYADVAMDELLAARVGHEVEFEYVVVQSTVRYLKPAHFHEVMTILLGITHIGNTSFSTEAIGSIQGQGEVFRCKMAYVHVDIKTGKPMPIPANISSKLKEGCILSSAL